jgi:hypothetical protein
MRRALPLLFIAFVVACQDQGPTGLHAPGDASGAFSDAAHNNGNDRFYLLPPMVRNPSPDGVFNPRLRPRVTVCELTPATETGCVSPVADFTMATGISVPSGAQHYQVDWNTSESDVRTSVVYRILFYLSTDPAALLLGFADVQFASNMQGVRNLQTDEVIGLQEGRTLPVRFRIEEGASCAGTTDCGEAVVGPAGGLVTTVEGYAGVLIPEGALDGEILITVGRVDPTSLPWGRCLPTGLRQEEGCYEFDTEPALSVVNGQDSFKELVTVGVCLDEDILRPGKLTLHKYDPERFNQGVVELDGATANFLTCGGFTSLAWVPAEPSALGRMAGTARRVLGPLASIFTPRLAFARDLGLGGLTDSFSFIGWAEAASLSVLDAPGFAAPGGQVQATIQATTAHNHGTSGPLDASHVDLRFEYTTPSGAVTVLPGLMTDASGQATPSWTLTQEVGTHTLSVSTRQELQQGVVTDPTVIQTVEIAAFATAGACDNDPDCGQALIGPAGGVVTTSTGFAGVAVPEEAVGGDLLITVRRIDPATQPWGRCLPTGLRQEEGCYAFDTEPAIVEVNDRDTFFTPVTVGVCPDPAAARPEKLTLHKFDPDMIQMGVVELPGATASFLSCGGFAALSWMPSTSGFSRLAGLTRRAAGPVVSLVLPRLAYARDLGLGGLTDSFSFIGWAEAVELELVGTLTDTSPGAMVSATVRAMTEHNHGDPQLDPTHGPLPASGHQLRARYTDPTGLVAEVPVPGLTNALGEVTVSWQLTQATGSHTLHVSTRGSVGTLVIVDPTPVLPLVVQAAEQDTILVDPSSVGIVVGQSYQLTATRLDPNGQEVASSPTWFSGNPIVATVSSAGVVTGVAPGTVHIFAQEGSVIGAATVTVHPAGTTGGVMGTVSAFSGAPVAGANVQVLGTNIGTLTNVSGQFLINGVPGGTQTLRVSMIGYVTSDFVVEVLPNATVGVALQIQQGP